MKILNSIAVSIILVTGSVLAVADDGDSESRAMQFYALIKQMDQQIALAAKEADQKKRSSLLDVHRGAMMLALGVLREGGDKSACVLLEAHREDLKLACLTDTEARLRMSNQLLEQMVRRDVALDNR